MAVAAAHLAAARPRLVGITPQGRPYLEAHHVRRVSDGGLDHPRWVIALCPNCHRRVHHGQDGEQYNKRLASQLNEIELS
ncbi:HNH endonuclease [Salinibacter ruber]|uniref:HNH endonuclease n=1 Tax=Salinibacter ruber TaxID=146919 RepID=UPI002342D975